ncbi:MAG: alpha/beta fold hydrolase [Azospirillaceae bacterium]|nr:alpha/beta fold hydrolase [Azospirillaceae bacterium]
MTQNCVFLHGGQHGGWCWQRLLGPLVQEMGGDSRFLCLDIPGCGAKRTRAVDGLTTEAVVEELLADIAAAGAGPWTLIGHSAAGLLLPRMVVRRPELFARVIFLATCVPAEGETVFDAFGPGRRGEDPNRMGWPFDLAASTDEERFQVMFAPDMDAATYGWVVRECAQDIWPPAVMGAASRLDGFPGLRPTSFIVTARDPILPAAWQHRFAARAGATDVVEIDTPHEPFLTHPDLLARCLAARVA